MRQAKSFPIDVQKFRHALDVRNLKFDALSLEMGREKTYINTIIKHGRIVPSAAILLEKLHDIQRYEYELVQALPEPTPDEAKSVTVLEQPKAEIDYVQLYNTIYGAVLAALRQNAKDVKDRLFTAREAM